MARKYEVPFVTGCGHPIFAVDLRDVEPLVEALKQIGDAAKAESADALEWATWAHDLAQDRLKAFEEDSDA